MTSLIRRALKEDAASKDITSRAVIPAHQRIRARITAKASGVLAGGPVARWTFQAVNPSLRCALKHREGARITQGQTILTVEGSARSIFAAERTALNFLGHLSGIATLTQEFVRRVAGTRAVILDTRKTLPGLRALEKHAVRAGGGHNHRGSLAEAVLIKTNHLRALKARSPQSTVHSPQLVQEVIAKAKRHARGKTVEVEVSTLREFKVALEAEPDVIMLDNWPIDLIRKAVALRKNSPSTHHPSPLLEVSGGITLANVRAIAQTGVERISIGRLTHSTPSLDVSLTVI